MEVITGGFPAEERAFYNRSTGGWLANQIADHPSRA